MQVSSFTRRAAITMPARNGTYPLFNMGGQRYYTFQRKTGVLPPLAGDRVQFFALDSVNLDDDQLSWFDRQLSESKAEWKIVFFHHPIYSSGRYALSSAARRSTLEHALIEHEVDVVFAGHEHVYERMAPQSGVMYFVVGCVRFGARRRSAAVRRIRRWVTIAI